MPARPLPPHAAHIRVEKYGARTEAGAFSPSAASIDFHNSVPTGDAFESPSSSIDNGRRDGQIRRQRPRAHHRPEVRFRHLRPPRPVKRMRYQPAPFSAHWQLRMTFPLQTEATPPSLIAYSARIFSQWFATSHEIPWRPCS